MILDAPVVPILLLIAALQVKHFICDGPLQTKAMVISKAKYGDAMGALHSALHGVGTGIVFAVSGFPIKTVLILMLLDFVIHYHVDFSKENIVKKMGWTTHDAQFWWALSADQTIHQLTYVGLVALAAVMT
jgi:Protein of unknown function (DUF3307)